MSCEAGPFSVGSGLLLRLQMKKLYLEFVQELVILINIDW